MNIIIAGGGKVGITLARQLSAEKHDITLIDSSRHVLEAGMERFDIIAVQGICSGIHHHHRTFLARSLGHIQLVRRATSSYRIHLLQILQSKTHGKRRPSELPHIDSHRLERLTVARDHSGSFSS